MRTARTVLVALSTWCVFTSFNTKESNTLTINITSLRNNKGLVLISVYNSAEKFPKDAAKYALAKGKVAIANKTAAISFSDLPAGKYAVAILHDENTDQQMNFNIVGMPKEGFGFSNDAKGTFGPPSFSKAAFEIKNKETNIAIHVNYFL